jgi:hypothetical protein
MGDKYSEQNMMQMINMRMGWNVEDPKSPHRRVLPVQMKSRDRIVLFVVTGDEALIIEDDMALYPSDELVTKLRLIAQKAT